MRMKEPSGNNALPAIQIRGARQNNLKNLDLDIPLNRITVVSGVSGSGKSSLAFDTIYAEGQRRYVETFSPYARQFLDRMDRPRVDRIEGIPPAIAIDRKDPVRTSRSTVGTMTEITDYVKLLFARRGQLFCPQCQRPIQPDTPQHVWQQIRKLAHGSEIILTFPVLLASADPDSLRRDWTRLGYDRRFDGKSIEPIEHWRPQEGDTRLHLMADRIRLNRSQRERVVDSAEIAYRFGGGRLDVWIDRKQHLAFSNNLECAGCGKDFNPPLPNLFSFNSPVGACPTCRGFGRTIGIDMDLVIPDKDRSLEQGAIKPWGSGSDSRPEFDDLMDFCHQQQIPTDIAFRKLKTPQQQAIVDGTEDYYGVRGFFRWLETKTYKMPVRVFLSRYRSYDRCADCNGTRFKSESLLYRIGGQKIAWIYALNVDQAADFFHQFSSEKADEADRIILEEIQNRLKFLKDVGLGYLTLDRQSRTLSGGEVQRVALASSLGSSLVNTLYVLDEPSIGLHPRDSHRLIRILKRLRNLSNTIVVVEHDPEILREGDFLLDLGPQAGEKGGQIMYFGPTSAVNGSLTGQYLKGKRQIPVPAARRAPRRGNWLKIRGAAEHNLQEVDVRIPLGCFVCLTGVAGSGKSTLAEDILYNTAKRAMGDPRGKPGKHTSIDGLEKLEEVILVDQRPIGRTPRANPLTYTKAMDPIRRLLAATADAGGRNLGPGHFSFNVAGGRCENCKGDGFEKVEMQFLSDVFITCPSCSGRRFTSEVLQVRYQGRNIHQILNLTVDQALDFFKGDAAEHRRIRKYLSPLVEVGLGYMRLGQPINTLSGGEAQRLKLSRHMKLQRSGESLFIFDEPTTGLHFYDIERLLAAMQRLTERGHTVLVIEHNQDVIKTADWVIDLGPEGGDGGGQVVVAGPPETVAGHAGSHTGRFLRSYLNGSQQVNTDQGGHWMAESAAHYHPSASIDLNGAREHNLKNLDLTIPRNELVVLTGVSGSGKSTLAFDILFAEGQRRYLENLAPYVRQYMKILERPEVDLVTGLSPTVAIEQRISHASRRSTVATLTEIYHYLRLLFSKLGTPHCPGCGRPLTAQTRTAIVEEILRRYRNINALILAPKVAGRKGYHKEILSQAMKKGYEMARIDGELTTLTDGMALSRYHEHTIDILIGTINGRRTRSGKIERHVRRALDAGDGNLLMLDRRNRTEEIFSLHGNCPTCGIGVEKLDPRLFSFNSRQGACTTCDGLGETETHNESEPGDSSGHVTCPDCGGSRLKPESLAVKISGQSIWDLVQQPPDKLLKLISELTFTETQRPVAEPVLAELRSRLLLLDQLGLSYLALSRSGETLSGGEAQRVRLAAQLGSNLTGVCYILDEPTIGLHARDNQVLIKALRMLKNSGNSILVVEHDEETIRAADTVIDLGPGAGEDGGRLVVAGTVADLKNSAASITGACLDGHPRQIISQGRSYRKQPKIGVRGARARNLKSIDVDFPLGTFICLTGVSGSGKSTLLKETLYRSLKRLHKNLAPPAGVCRNITGWKKVGRVIEVDHSPIGRTPRSVPASYVGFLDAIRRLFALTPAARARAYKPGRFSFNVTGGRCEACKGQGHPKVAMSFLPDVYIPCEVCRGSRFNRETLAVTYKGKTIAEVLQMTFAEALQDFAAIPDIRRAVQFVCDIGLGYLRLGQPSPTLSGGEAQRIKLARQLARCANGHTFFVLDEPTTGLHMADTRRLIDVLQALVDAGNTVAVIEHNLDVVSAADYIIDLGPEGGNEGGRIVSRGSPRELLRAHRRSHTARHLKKYLTANG